MHCRRVRSFLSAYCRGELEGKQARAIADHMANCPACRGEEASVRDLFKLAEELPSTRVSADFNSRLLNRIAEARHQETRTKAYLPKGVPVFTVNRVAPVLAVVCFALAFVFAGGLGNFQGHDDPLMALGEAALDDSYLTVQPVNEHWAFQKQLNRATRIQDLMGRIMGQSSFNSFAGQTDWIQSRRPMIPVPVFIIPSTGSQHFMVPAQPETLLIREVNADS